MTDFLCWLRNDTAELSRAFVAAQSLLGLKGDVMRLILSILYKVLAAASGFSFFPQFGGLAEFLLLIWSYGAVVLLQRVEKWSVNGLCCESALC